MVLAPSELRRILRGRDLPPVPQWGRLGTTMSRLEKYWKVELERACLRSRHAAGEKVGRVFETVAVRRKLVRKADHHSCFRPNRSSFR